MTKFETRFFLVILPATAIITLAGWAYADTGSGIIKGPSISFAGKARDRQCQIVERVNQQTGKVTRKLECAKKGGNK